MLGILGMSHGRRDASGTQLLALHSWEWEADESRAEAGSCLPFFLWPVPLSLQSRWDDKDSQGHFAAAS